LTQITFIGHAAVEIQSGGFSILVDPFISQNPAAVQRPEDFKPQAILLSHGHFDHLGDAVELAKTHRCPIIAIFELANYCQAQGTPAVEGLNIGGPRRFDFGQVTLTPAFHSSSSPEGQYLGQPCGLLLQTNDGQHIYHAGDTSLFGDMALIGLPGLDLALLPIGSTYTMGPEAALEAVKLLKPKRVIPIHYNTFPAIEQDAAAFKRAVESATRSQVIVLQPGEHYSW